MWCVAMSDLHRLWLGTQGGTHRPAFSLYHQTKRGPGLASTRPRFRGFSRVTPRSAATGRFVSSERTRLTWEPYPGNRTTASVLAAVCEFRLHAPSDRYHAARQIDPVALYRRCPQGQQCRTQLPARLGSMDVDAGHDPILRRPKGCAPRRWKRLAVLQRNGENRRYD